MSESFSISSSATPLLRCLVCPLPSPSSKLCLFKNLKYHEYTAVKSFIPISAAISLPLFLTMVEDKNVPASCCARAHAIRRISISGHRPVLPLGMSRWFRFPKLTYQDGCALKLVMFKHFAICFAFALRKLRVIVWPAVCSLMNQDERSVSSSGHPQCVTDCSHRMLSFG
jgi:hypothetical protein